MSHGKLRKENNCLNCNAVVTGRFCSVCGQENIEPKETFWQLVTHFTSDVFHYDGQFLSTAKVLFFKPGLLTLEYVRGKRASYLHPVRLYIFASAFCFLILFSFFINENNIESNKNHLSEAEISTIYKSIDRLKDSASKENNPAVKAILQQSIVGLQNVPGFFADTAMHSATENKKDLIRIDTSDHAANFLSSKLPATLNEYKAQQDSLSPDKKDGGFNRIVSTRLIELNEKYRYNLHGFVEDFEAHFFICFPQ